ncbi:hypothetical protein AK830_g8702 [Neonectria ditissima]|uniref:tyrosinase n=1 Tax=Neonectria ditissima TaxID=78410 RepID=A0A0P7B7E5_9HYPO|nr:hypothetical protein AK830_g8702 [Neonectria ditissima]
MAAQAPKIYWRAFTRNGTDDEDTLASEQFLEDNLTDFFGKWLQEGSNTQIQTYDGLVTKFSGNQYDINTFMVAEAGFLDRKKFSDGDYFNPMIRFLTLVTIVDRTPFSTSSSEWTLCIVGSSRPKNPAAFLQVASWDGSTFRFYQKDKPLIDRVNGVFGDPTWNYFGQSMDAFGAFSYLGPFNGHVNGACIMKEVRNPWIHWLGGETHDFQVSLSNADIRAFREVPWLTQEGGSVLSAVNSNPNSLETAIERGVRNWFSTRQKQDFFTSSKTTLKTNPSNIPRWTSHLFLTTTVNMTCADDAVEQPAADYDFPLDHFYDQELLGLSFTDLLPEGMPQIGFKEVDYRKAVAALELCLLTEAGPKDKPDVILSWQALGQDRRGEDAYEDLRFKILLKNSEGLSPFNILHASLEDAAGVEKMQTLKKVRKPGHSTSSFLGLFSVETFNAIIMVDFWNPIYSWKRGCLMQYVPSETTFDTTYDIDARFVENVKNSQYAQLKIDGSPEYEFVKLLDVDAKTHQAAILEYLGAIQARMNENPLETLIDYLTLAESRRRIYRPLPLDEFGPTMPFALGIDPKVPLFKEMKPDATIQDMPERGRTFLQRWTQSLSGFDPQILPQSEDVVTQAQAPLAIHALPRPAQLAIPCQSNTPGATPSSAPLKNVSGCPFMSKNVLNSSVFALETGTSAPERVPNWTDDILPLVKTPYWVSGDPETTGTHWIGKMVEWGNWDLSKYEHVKKRAVGIYQHLRSKSMPITRDPQNYWPEEALEIFRNWANAGFPYDQHASPSSHGLTPLIPKPTEPRDIFRVRRDIMSLSKEELAIYQSKLDDVLQVGALQSKWQELGLLHAYWCLHYQEATFPWHRAYLLYVEKLIDFPIPYWNGYAPEAATETSRFAGIPPMFLEDKYIHPVDGSTRPNPLKFALALDAKSKSGTCKYVTRCPVLTEGPSSPGWKTKIDLFKLYHQQISHALSQPTYTTSETAEHFGVPWANITTFSDNQGDDLYPFRFDFDGLFEQVHDNFHGWVGPDMADNTYTAFDPIFLSYHANMDRLTGIFMDAHPGNQFTSAFPLQPFVDNGTGVSYDDSRRWRYTTIGDMAKDTRALGYMYGAPASPDAFTPESAEERGILAIRASGGRAISLPAGLDTHDEANGNKISIMEATKTPERREREPYVVFTEVGCTASSYRVDVFAAGAKSTLPGIDNADFIGQVTRLGMGPGRQGAGPPNTGRCRKPVATRVLSADKVREQLSHTNQVEIVVTDLETGKQVEQGEYTQMPGFVPKVVWLPKRDSQS